MDQNISGASGVVFRSVLKEISGCSNAVTKNVLYNPERNEETFTATTGKATQTSPGRMHIQPGESSKHINSVFNLLSVSAYAD